MNLLAITTDRITFADVVAFLEQKIREKVRHDYKANFPADNYALAKTLAAFANTMGGIVLVGIGQERNGEPTLPPSGLSGDSGNKLAERVQQIAHRYIWPPVPIEVMPIEIPPGEPNQGKWIVIVRVHESDQAPHSMVDDNAIYIRRDEMSEPETFIALRWLEQLLKRRTHGERLRDEMFKTALSRLPNLVHDGHRAPRPWFTFSACPAFPFGNLKSTREILEIVKNLVRVKQPVTFSDGVVVDLREISDGPTTFEARTAGFFFEAWAPFFATEEGKKGKQIWEGFSHSFEAPILIQRVAGAWAHASYYLQKVGWSGLVQVQSEIHNVQDRVLIPGPTAEMWSLNANPAPYALVRTEVGPMLSAQFFSGTDFLQLAERTFLGLGCSTWGDQQERLASDFLERALVKPTV